MATVPDLTPIQLAFTEAVRQFKSKLKNDQLYADILKTKSIDEVYDKTDALQIELGKQGRIRNLSKIRPFLEGLRSYADVIDTFIQVKPDVLALIWGPIKLLIQWTASLTQSMDAIINTAAEIGSLLPDFKLMATMFGYNEHIKDVLVLFFRDILDFYAVTLKFFTSPHWRFMFEAVWPSQKDRIKLIIDNIGRSTNLMRTKVTLEHIREEYEHRQRASAHFKATQKSNMRQEYNVIKTDISPQSYGADLYRIRGQVCAGTGNWLKQDSDFKKWLDVDDDSTRMLWLCGIPGAGKTHLASMAIDYVTSTKTIFAFISHTNKNTTSALSVMHSLIFQLASEDERLQAVLCGSSRKRLSNNLEVAVGVMQTLLNSTDPVSIIVDGVDEIESFERARLLKNLCDITTVCTKTRLFISSRAEHDISAILSQISSTIRVDTHNMTSIQTFIDNWAKDWFSARDFLPADKSEIEDLFKPLALKAKGMFLYARIVLNSIEELDNVDEIRDELRVLPESLDEAYERVFAKIENKSNVIKKKCRLILGWISCSPTPLTLPELEQALVVTISGTYRVSSRLNFIRLCGPIIEVVGDHLQFVHFTVKEVEYYIDPIEATLSLTICCVQYLCQDHHSPDISNEDVKMGIERGNYRLHYYAANTWLNLTIQYLRLTRYTDISEELIAALTKFCNERGKPECYGHEELKEEQYPSELQRIRSHDPNLFGLLQSFAQFQQKSSSSLYNLEEDHYWIGLSPVTTSTISKMLYTQFDQYQCDPQQHPDQCLCSTLSWHYGQRLYKCDFFSCSFYQHGFETPSVRGSHRKCHDGAWKCDVPSCQYSKIGFLSKAMRDKHLNFHNAKSEADEPSNETLLPNVDTDGLQHFLFDLVSTDNVKLIEKLPPFFEQLPDERKEELLNLVAQSGTEAMTRLIYERAEKYINTDILHQFLLACIDAQKLEFLTFLMSDNASKIVQRLRDESLNIYYNINKLLVHSVATGSMELIRTIERFVVEYNVEKHHPLLSIYLEPDMIKATARCSDREDYLINAWSTHGLANVPSAKISRLLITIAVTTCSIRLAQVLIQHGAIVDWTQNKNSFTALASASYTDSAEAADYTKFLLYQGADPNASRGLVSSRDPGITLKWLGVSWDELVQKAKEDRERGIQWP
ncbi:hypothetical protein TRIATDRAFT_295808 [Trichoderma atroviride IMI 206040]|uniref:Uncharacterized protein n=1 Tax=Hypocrea atroviridis (strain ATCC 20476 / IMI 206040) TaxID=452589 RepID=G9P4Y4_HYPAI|nr:uncharacterized protein TRIATDRAFT_295808 [Trichoderma atroviride IMI 206040]EHK42065.1 hypothetical protein TRIATDRAFT_295808 [Trichoderma atroviride IMI 206040]